MKWKNRNIGKQQGKHQIQSMGSEAYLQVKAVDSTSNIKQGKWCKIPCRSDMQPK